LQLKRLTKDKGEEKSERVPFVCLEYGMAEQAQQLMPTSEPMLRESIGQAV